MTKTKSTKRALLLSALSLFMCVSMLIGSTFAWFTDSVTTGSNIIKSGNLDVDLIDASGASMSGEIIEFVAKDGRAQSEILWEPGCTYKTEPVRVVNKGNLALKYKITISGITGDAKLLEVIDWTVTIDGVKTDLSTFEGELYPETGKDISGEIVLSGHMKEEAGNDYEDLTVENIAISVYASQLTAESDSFDDQYDKDATYPAKNLKINTDKEFVNACKTLKAGDSITLLSDITLSEQIELPAGIILNGNGKQINGSIYAGGDLTIAGHTKVTSFSASYYSRTINIEQGACLEVTGTGRVTLGYDNVFNIVGNLADAKNTDKTTIQPSLIIPGGMSITGGNDATINVTNAYIKVGGTSSKNNAANGTFSLNFTNSIVDFTNQFTLSEPTSGKNPTFKIAIKDSVLTTATKLCVAAANSTIVIDNSDVILGTYLRNSGNITLKNKSTLKGQTIQFGENGGNNGTIIVDNSKFTINANSTGQAFDGKGIGEIVLNNGATALVDYYKDMTITHDATSTFTGTEVN